MGEGRRGAPPRRTSFRPPPPHLHHHLLLVLLGVSFRQTGSRGAPHDVFPGRSSSGSRGLGEQPLMVAGTSSCAFVMRPLWVFPPPPRLYSFTPSPSPYFFFFLVSPHVRVSNFFVRPAACLFPLPHPGLVLGRWGGKGGVLGASPLPHWEWSPPSSLSGVFFFFFCGGASNHVRTGSSPS